MTTRRVTAEVAGTVWKLAVAVGDQVAVDDPLIVIECMKMEIPAASPWAGKVAAIHVAEGGLIEEGQLLVELET